MCARMRSEKLFIGIFIITFVVLLSVLPLLNLYIDRARVLSQDTNRFYLKLRPFINTPFSLTCHFFEQQQKYDGLLFGSSRITAVDLAKLDSITGKKWFKFNYAGGHTLQHLSILKAILKKQSSIEQVVIALDDLQLVTLPSFYLQDYYRRPYPDNLLSWFRFYLFYFFKAFSDDEKKILQGKAVLQDWDIENAQKWIGIKKTQDILQLDPWVRWTLDGVVKYVDFVEMLEGWANSPYMSIDNVLADLSEIKELCTRNGITLTILYTPRHYKTFLDRNFNEIDRFKERLVQIQPFWDFSGLTAFTLQDRYWIETSHFIPEVADTMMAQVFSKNEDEGLFGALVSQENVIEHNRSVRNSVFAKLLQLLDQDKRIFVSETLMSDIEYCRLTFENQQFRAKYEQVVLDGGDQETEGVVVQITSVSDAVQSSDFLIPFNKEAIIEFDLVSKEEIKFQISLEQDEEDEEK